MGVARLVIPLSRRAGADGDTGRLIDWNVRRTLVSGPWVVRHYRTFVVVGAPVTPSRVPDERRISYAVIHSTTGRPEVTALRRWRA